MFNMRKQNLDLRSKLQCYRRMIAKNEKDNTVSDEAISRQELEDEENSS